MDEKRTTRAERYAIDVAPHEMHRFGVHQSPWHEELAEVHAKLAWGEAKQQLMAWVERQMALRLTARERHCIEMYYFESMTYREAAAKTNTNATSVLRAVRRGLKKLRQAAAEHEEMQLLYERQGRQRRTGGR